MADTALGLCTHLIGSRDYLPFARRCFNRIQESGAGWIREDIHWHRIECKPRQFDYSYPETFWSLTQEAGLKVLGILGFSNRNLDQGILAEARQRGQYQEWLKRFSEYAARTIEHFRDRIDHWEIWNEPNIPTFWPSAPNPAEYADMVKAIYPLAKQANPSSTIVAGATAGADTAFLQSLYRHGIKGFFDAYSCHPYYHQHPSKIPGQRRKPDLSALSSVRTILDAMGDPHVPLWITEIGYPSVDYLGGDKEQAIQLRTAIESYAELESIGPIFWYDLKDDGSDARNTEHRFGIVRGDLSLKPAFFAFQEQAIRLGSQKPTCNATLGLESIDPSTIRVIYQNDSLILHPNNATVENYPLTAIEGLEMLSPEEISRILFDCRPTDMKSWRLRGSRS